MGVRKELARLEAALFAAEGFVTPQRLADALGLSETETAELLKEYRELLAREARGFTLDASPEGYRLVSRADFSDTVARLVGRRPERLSEAVLETLAVVAYHQPVTRAEIDRRRGVRSSHALDLLLELGLVEDIGRREGRALLYGTTAAFLELFALGSLKDLPPLPEGLE